ncbi:MAG: MFS transporter [Acidobacteria bacterium]|jgi:MFS family permease|nr:MFS transporter [Acidobacteriota bacterium]
MSDHAPAGLAAAFKNTLRELGQTFAAFLKAPRALWGVNIPYVFEGLVYFGLLTVLGKYCSENILLSDVQSGWVLGGVTGGITFAMLLFGGVSDRIGVRVSLALSLGVMMLGYVLIALSGMLALGRGMGSPMFFVMVAGLLLIVTAYGLYMPAAYAGVKRYTNPQTAAIGYAVIYGLMNLGAFLSGFISSGTRRAFESDFPPNGLVAVYWTYAAILLFSMLLTLLLITRKVDAQAVARVARETRAMNTAEQNQAADAKAAAAGKKVEARVPMGLFYLLLSFAAMGLGVAILNRVGRLSLPWPLVFALLGLSVLGAGWEFLRRRPDHPFRDSRFVFFIFILIPVQTLFAHNWLTIPYYLDRAFAGTGVSRYFEVFSNLNPVLIFILSPLIAALTARSNVYKMMIAGTFVMALPTFLLALGPNVYLFLLYILVMSVGEAMWQPRFLQWVAEIAPEGKTGLYMGIGQFPWFLTKMLTSLYSGYVIARYCPKPGLGLPMNTGAMWLMYAFIAMVSPIALVLARKWMAKGMTRKG